MANITIETNWTARTGLRSAFDHLFERLRVWARLRRIARTRRRRLLRLIRAETLDQRMLADIGVVAPRNRVYDCIARLAWSQRGSL